MSITIDQLTNENKALTEKLADKEAYIVTLEKIQETMQEQLSEKDKTLGSCYKQQTELRKEIAGLQKERAALRKEVLRLKGQ
jgi:peptidoglycan hydrolase CwlO-like protein